jgi:hypothetical protein
MSRVSRVESSQSSRERRKLRPRVCKRGRKKIKNNIHHVQCTFVHARILRRRFSVKFITSSRVESIVRHNNLSLTAQNESIFIKTSELSRLMVQSDANVAGKVHGGTIMQMIEKESACVAASCCFNYHGERREYAEGDGRMSKSSLLVWKALRRSSCRCPHSHGCLCCGSHGTTG